MSDCTPVQTARIAVKEDERFFDKSIRQFHHTNFQVVENGLQSKTEQRAQVPAGDSVFSGACVA